MRAVDFNARERVICPQCAASSSLRIRSFSAGPRGQVWDLRMGRCLYELSTGNAKVA
jgi:hypothetical protein